MDTVRLQAVVFDFDGLIVDTETPIYAASANALAELGHSLSVEDWATVIGLGEADSFAALCRATGVRIDQGAFDAAYEAQDRTGHHDLPVLPGVVELLEALAQARIPCAVASSSSTAWVDGHLRRLGLRARFASLATADRVGGRSKPAPDTYQLACRDLGVDPAGCVALEDSAPGALAARAAGLRVVAVPSVITRHTDLSVADACVDSLVDLDVATLTALVADGRHRDAAGAGST